MILDGQYTSLEVLINKTLDLFFNLITKTKYFCLQNKLIDVNCKIYYGGYSSLAKEANHL